MHLLALLLVISAQPGADSLRTAQTQVREALAANRNQNITVTLADGVYPLSEPLVLGAEDSPAEPFAVTWQAAEGAKPLISGGRELRKREDGSYDLGDAKPISDLFVNGAPAIEARHPNTGYHRVEKVGKGRRTSFTYRDGDLPPGEYAGAHLLFLHDWSTSRVPIAAVDAATRTLSTSHPVGPNARHYAMDHFEKQPRYAIIGARLGFDAPGEWLQDGASLHYRPRAEETDAKLVAPLAEQLIVARDVANIRFHGLTFAHTAWDIPERGHAGRQASWFEERGGSPIQRLQPIASALDFANAVNCELRDCELRNLGGGGIIFGKGSRHNRILDCELRDIGANGIGIGDSSDSDAASGNVIDGCLLTRCGRRFAGAVGIWIGIAADTRVTHCELRDLPYTGISLGWRWWSPSQRPHPVSSAARGSYIADNHIHHVMQTLSDGGGIYTLGTQPGTVICRNRIHDIPLNLGRAESNGMFLDQGSGLLLIEDNLLYAIERAPFRFHKGWHCELRNNRVVLSKGASLVTYNDTVKSRIRLEGNKVLDKAP
jgi:hypothetical protein